MNTSIRYFTTYLEKHLSNLIQKVKHCLNVLKKYQSSLYTEILQIQGQNSCMV